MNRNTTWANIGDNIEGVKNVEEALIASNLNYEVVKEPIFLGNGCMIQDKFATKIAGEDTVFGVVGKDYNIIQNAEAFNFVDGIAKEGMQFVKAGTVHNGNTVYIIGKLDSTHVLGDSVTPYVIFQNSHNGGGTVKATICPLRIVCQNQFARSFKNAENAVAIRHTTNAKARMQEAQHVLTQSATYMEVFKQEAETLAAIHVGNEEVKAIAKLAFPIETDSSARVMNSMEDKRRMFMRAYNAEDNQNLKGTAFGIINAFSDYTTHKPLERKTENGDANNFIKTTLDTTAMDVFTQLVMERVA